MAVTYLLQNQEEGGRRWKFGDCEFIEIRRELLVHGEPVKLESKPLEVLQHLLEHPTQVLTKDELIGAAWATSTTDQSLTTAISKLRKAFGGARDSIIRSVSGIGYRMGVRVVCEIVDELAPTTLRLKVGDVIPGRSNWQVVRLLTASGPHSVCIAEHRKTREARVFKFATDGVRLRALQREVTISRLLHQALGDKAGFVRILDWDFEREPFFIESDYCGLDLFEWSETELFANLSLAQRVALAADIAETVAAAHGLGILHNDLKPANVLIVDREFNELASPTGAKALPPNPWEIRVADFGVASVSDLQRLVDLQITHYGSFEEHSAGGMTPAGTAMYRAPELLAGASPSVQGDVYALGVVLYQIVCGDFLEAPSIGWESRIADPIVREDIAAAANIDPEQRITSASELVRRLRSLDVRRTEIEHRAAEAIVAEQARRQMEAARLRRPWLILAIVALAAGLGASLWFALSAERARKTAESDAAHARRLEKFTEGLFTGGDDRVPSKDVTAETLLERGVKRALALNDDPPEQADLLQTLGEVYDAMGSFSTADRLLLDAMHERQRISGTGTPEFARTLLALSSLRDEQGRAAEALSLAQQAYDIDIKALPADAAQTLEAQVKIGSALISLGSYQKAVPLLDEVVQKDRGKPDRLTDLSEALGELSIATFYLGDVPQTLRLDVEGLAIDRQRLGDAHPDVGADLINLSQLETQVGDYVKAEKDARQALAIYSGWFAPGHYEIAGAEATLSDPLIYEGRTQEVLPLLEDALRTQQADFPGANEKTAHTLASFAHAEHSMHHLDVALNYYQKAAEQYLSLVPDKDYRFASMLFHEGEIYREQDHLPQAERSLREALDIDTKRLPATDRRLLDIRLLLGEVLLAKHQPVDAQPFLAQSYRDASAGGPPEKEERERAAQALRGLDPSKGVPAHNH